MDPFTEKLLERTRARRENLQKKMAERPNATNRQMSKRPREPLTDTNGVGSQSVGEEVPQVSSKPSPSKRRCSEENGNSAADENQEPATTRAVAPVPSDPPTDKKPPVGPAGVRHSSSFENTSTRPAVQSRPEQLKTAQAKPEKMAVIPNVDPLGRKEAQTASIGSTLQRNAGDLEADPAPPAAGMKSRFQRLAEQRKCWDGTSDPPADCTPPLLRSQADVPPPVTPTNCLDAPLGRKGRLANLAATIGSWEDDLSHANIPKEKPGAVSVSKQATVAASSKPHAAGPSSATQSKSKSYQEAVHSPAKSGRVVFPSPQKDAIPASKPAPQSVNSPQKSSNQGAPFLSGPEKTVSSSSSSVAPGPLQNQAVSRGLNHVSSPQKSELHDSPTISGSLAHQGKSSAGAPVVKSFLERFGERCQQRSNHGIPSRVTTPAQTSGTPSQTSGTPSQTSGTPSQTSGTPSQTSGTPSKTSGTPSVTPNTKLVQERLQAARAAITATADLTHRQKLEREAELAQIRSRFQKGKDVWKNRDEGAGTKKETGNKEQHDRPVEYEVAPCEPQDEPKAPSYETECTPPDSGLMASPPVSTSSPLRLVGHPVKKMTDETPEEREVVKETEANVDESINSAVINELFDAVLEQSDEDEEEDALNISSMSILAPLAETVAAAAQSPDRMTSTPASSFILKNNTPENVLKPNKFQRTNMVRTPSDCVDALDEDHKLPYSIDAYRSIRVKETERPNVKQVIVRKEDVSQRADEPRGSTLFSIKQRTKILTNDMNLQQTVIHQASQALNCCTDEEHGKGSQVEAEAERLLLVATEKREALKVELERLKGDPAGQRKARVAPEPAPSKGSITLQELRLPLKADFVCSTANKPESTKHSFFIIICAGAENRVATPLASTHCGLSGDTLTFPTSFALSDVSSDFQIALEVYCLVQKREVCSDKKKKPNKSKAMTPKRFLAITKSAQTPVVASPGGPNAVRTSNFVLVGSQTLSLSSIGKNKFPLEKVPFLCPLEGHIYLKMQCEVGSKVEERGFLTMFEDVSGFGAWHRRWCVLSGYCISYWTYPDDEKRKNPIGRINLANCTSKTVEPANREFCARPNTFELVTVRPQREDDKETLVSQCKNTMCVTKNWLSADTKDERNLWMRKLNQILVDLRMWQPDACFRPL
ncbi:anillin [Odontesthes bonariensis]|uniref:anillin n=1 Tax=Odontesthes bonariensis TaxID=219752 RepID=UPI003F58E5A9